MSQLLQVAIELALMTFLLGYRDSVRSLRRAASFVERFIFLSEKVILNQGVFKRVLRDQAMLY